jgi:hypothetical protein
MFTLTPTKYDFSGSYKKVPYIIDEDYLNDKSSIISFVKSYYFDNDSTDFTIYQKMIELAIKTNNIEALSGLWDGIYYHDRDHPAYDLQVKLAVEFSNLDMVKFCFHGYNNYAILYILESFSKSELLILSKNNIDVNLYIQTLPDVICRTKDQK